MYLIDTMVLSELRRRQRDAGVEAWIAEQRQEDCFLSVVSVGEIERVIAMRRAADPVFAGELAAWLDRAAALARRAAVGCGYGHRAPLRSALSCPESLQCRPADRRNGL